MLHQTVDNALIQRMLGQDYSVVLDIFKFLKSARLGVHSLDFYEQWALFEAANRNFTKAKSVMDSALSHVGEEYTDSIKSIMQNINQLEMQAPSINKENIYPSTLISRKKLISTGLKTRNESIQHDQVTNYPTNSPNHDSLKELDTIKVYFNMFTIRILLLLTYLIQEV